MRLFRTPIISVLCMTLLASLAPAGAVEAPQAGSCCGQEKPRETDPPRGCDSRHCVASCCRMVPAQADSVPPLAVSVDLAPEAPAHPPAPLRSLTDQSAIFHPPRA